MDIDWNVISEIFKLSPAIVALLVVIYLQHRQLVKKDELLKTILQLSDEYHARQSKLMTLLEVLVNRREA